MEEEAPIKVDKWDHNAVRIALDDAAKKAILELGYEENFKLVDNRLLICTTAVLFALFALLWDFLHPFPDSRPVLIICVCSYFVLMGILTIYANFCEKNIFLVAHQKDPVGTDPDIVWTLSSNMTRYESDYKLMITVADGSDKRNASLTKCVGDVFDQNGVLLYDVYEPIVRELHNSIMSGKKRN